MPVLKSKYEGFNVTEIEKEKIAKVVQTLDIKKSEFLRETVMKEVARLEKKSKQSSCI